VTQKEFRKLAAMTGELLIDLNSAQGRFTGDGDGEKRDARKGQILDSLRSIGLTAGDLAAIAASDREWNIIDYVGGILRSARNKVPGERLGEWQAATKPLSDTVEGLKSTSPDTLRNLLEQFGLLDPERIALIEDYRHYINTGEQRRPSIWSQRYAW
jgi:hypothetical protein